MNDKVVKGLLGSWIVVAYLGCAIFAVGLFRDGVNSSFFWWGLYIAVGDLFAALIVLGSWLSFADTISRWAKHVRSVFYKRDGVITLVAYLWIVDETVGLCFWMVGHLWDKDNFFYPGVYMVEGGFTFLFVIAVWFCVTALYDRFMGRSNSIG